MKEKNRKVKILISISPEIKEKLNETSSSNGLCMSEVVRRGIIRELKILCGGCNG